MARFIPVRIVKVGQSLYFRLPREFIRANNLKPGDMLMPDLDTFKIVKPEDLAVLYEGLEVAPAG
jgi:hypothetical protein